MRPLARPLTWFMPCALLAALALPPVAASDLTVPTDITDITVSTSPQALETLLNATGGDPLGCVLGIVEGVIHQQGQMPCLVCVFPVFSASYGRGNMALLQVDQVLIDVLSDAGSADFNNDALHVVAHGPGPGGLWGTWSITVGVDLHGCA
ncbi:MAG: hypothetical protein ACYDBQ_08880 [Thermoplasmatota archaeon]